MHMNYYKHRLWLQVFGSCVNMSYQNMEKVISVLKKQYIKQKYVEKLNRMAWSDLPLSQMKTRYELKY